MSDRLSTDLATVGVAQVMVILKPGLSSAKAVTQAALSMSPLRSTGALQSRVASLGVTSLQKHFQTSELTLDSALAASVDAASPLVPQVAPPSVRYFPNLGVMLGHTDRAGLKALRQSASVDSVQGAPQLLRIRPNRVAAAKMDHKLTWGIRRIKAHKLWEKGFTGEGVLIGHLDTGVDGGHAVFRKGAIASFAEFDALGFQTQNTTAYDSEDHGTHTAATIAGRPVSGRRVGVAPGAALASAVVIEGGNVIARVLGGMDWAIGQGVKILNMSLGFPGYVEEFLGLTRVIRAQGILPVFAVGNEGAGTSRSPGNYHEALSVGAMSYKGRVADFSSSMRFKRAIDPVVPDLVAPGVGIVSAKPGKGYQEMDGSSMATPHISGLAALLWQAVPDASASDIESVIYESCRRGNMPVERANRGLPDGIKALKLLQSS